nr:protein PTCD3 homolog, mitochondrial isoform X1 [Osmia lignaria]
MNHFKYISSSRCSWCQFKRLQSSSSNSTIQIPPRIERKPTDILNALESTIPKDKMATGYVYHDDPFLLPTKKQNHRIYALSYESGKKTAMWVHKAHGNLFPRNLSEPMIKAFKPPIKYTRKDQVSEEILLQAMSEYRLSDAVDIYELLETNVSNKTKQALLELLCFYNYGNVPYNTLPIEHWYSKPAVFMWKHNKQVDDLYKFLIEQDPETAALAHNAMLCGLAKCSRIDESWMLFEKCENENIPLTVTTYNYIMKIMIEIYNKKNEEKVANLYKLLKSMAKRGIKPNIWTLNAALKLISTSPSLAAENLMKHLCKEFKQLNIKFSLASYRHIIKILVEKGDSTYNDFMHLLHTVSKENFTIQDPMDVTFFSVAMECALKCYNDRKAGDMIHKIFLTGDNYKFISDSDGDNLYYNSYIRLLLRTSTIDEFFKFYEEFVPNEHIPSVRLYTEIVNELKFHEQKAVAKYVARIWSDITLFGYMNLSLKLFVISLMEIACLPAESPLRTVFVDAAWTCWNDIKMEIQNKLQTYTPVQTAMTGSIVMMLLCGNRINESMDVLSYTIEQPHLFVPTMTKEQLTKLFESYISKDCITGTLLVLQYATNFGFPEATEMARKLYDHPQLTDIDRNKLINLVGEEALDTLDKSKS